MKTLFLARDFPPEIGGVQTVLGRMAALWQGEVTVIACAAPGDRDHDVAYPVKIVRVPAFKNRPKFVGIPLRQIAFFLALVSVWRIDRFDRIVCGYLSANAPAAFLWNRLFGVPYIVMTYGMEILRLERTPLRRFWRRILLGAEAVVTIAEFFSEFLHRFAPGTRVVKVPLGCGTVAHEAVPLPEPYRGRTLSGRRVLLTVGRLVPRKGVDTVLSALALLRGRRPDLFYIVVGEGPDRARLEEEIRRLDLADRVLLTGGLDRAELDGLYCKAEIFVMPSRRIGDDAEGFGIVFVEAGAFGVPVIGGRSGGIPDAVHDGVNGLLVDPESPEDLAEKISALLEDPSLARRLGDEGRRMSQEIFTFENMTRKLLDYIGKRAET